MMNNISYHLQFIKKCKDSHLLGTLGSSGKVYSEREEAKKTDPDTNDKENDYKE